VPEKGLEEIKEIVREMPLNQTWFNDALEKAWKRGYAHAWSRVHLECIAMEKVLKENVTES
jgi:hypothetical protein